MKSLRQAVSGVVTLLLLATACDGSVDVDGQGGGLTGSGGNGPSTTGVGGSGGQGGQLPPECLGDTGGDPTLGVTFTLTNPGDTPLYLREECHLRYDILGCADGYTQRLPVHPPCAIACSAEPSQDCISCIPCLMAAEELPPRGQLTRVWKGQLHRTDTNAAGCFCVDTSTAPAARYRLRVPVYATAADAEEDVSPRWVSVDFELPTLDGPIAIPLTP
ncbi:hypothetical protein [Chondromyces crocatus]|uniref:Lipoprotein n=1 Tax=Chondromyces crocatus TaxID=52 RepID=A0A0K1EQ11_CHOCO|nr:hypothetical protein [Chondromyces crocatus]AKT42732.1 uncharacterized protein CMC5_069590 [Chondromyces crocatus]